jgi:predicted acylesterase/phospholipase RssA
MLDRAEAAHDLVLLDAGTAGAADAWTEFCLQQADRILAVTGGRAAPLGVPGRPELMGCDLVAYDVPPGLGALARTAESLAPTESHLVRSSERDGDMERLARRLSGRSVGIVLSGGGARAFAHIGVLEELMAAGVTIDRVTGVSMGAFVGALFAMGLDADAIDQRCFEEWVQRRPLGDYTLPRYGLIRGKRVRAMLDRTFGQTTIEELPRSYMCACAELRSGRLVVSRFGPLWEAVGFSMSLPILGQPQVRGRELFIDGSLVDNLPVQVMANLGEGPIIAVDVKASFERADGDRRPDIEDHAPRQERPPSLGETLTRVLLLASENTSETARRHADLIIKPRAGGVGLLEFHQLDEARQAGRVAVREALAQAPAWLFG